MTPRTTAEYRSRLIRAGVCCVTLSALLACSAASGDTEHPEKRVQQLPKPASSGFVDAAEGLRVHYEVFGQGEPIVVMAGGFGDSASMVQVIGPLSRQRQVIAIDLEGHGRTPLRQTPMTHEKNGDDVATVLRHLKINRADVAGCSHGADAAIRMTIQHAEMVRNLIVISTAAERDGWYPEVLRGMESVGASKPSRCGRRLWGNATPRWLHTPSSFRLCSIGWAS